MISYKFVGTTIKKILVFIISMRKIYYSLIFSYFPSNLHNFFLNFFMGTRSKKMVLACQDFGLVSFHLTQILFLALTRTTCLTYTPNPPAGRHMTTFLQSNDQKSVGGNTQYILLARHILILSV